MGISSMLFLGVVAVIVIYGVMLYNGLVSLKHGVAKAGQYRCVTQTAP